MTEKEKIDAAVAKAVAEALQKADDDKAEAVELAKAQADADRQKAIDEAVANAKADAKAESDKMIERILQDADADINAARSAGAASASRGGRTDELKHYVLIETSFIGGSLLAPGSRVTSDDLGTYYDPVTGTDKPVKAGETLVEVNEDGSPVDRASADKLRAVAGDVAGIPIAAVQPFSPNPTRPQGAPTQAPGGVSLAEQHLRTLPPEGVESNAAAAARGEQGENSAAAVAAMTAGEKPRRRGSSS